MTTLKTEVQAAIQDQVKWLTRAPRRRGRALKRPARADVNLELRRQVRKLAAMGARITALARALAKGTVA